MPSITIVNRIALALATLLLSTLATAADPPAFDPAEIRAATAKLIRALEDPDPTAWVYLYTEDAGLLEAGSAPLQGRPALLELARTMKPMSAVSIETARIEGLGNLAYLSGSGSWVDGRPPKAGPTSRVRLVMVWRKEADGQWRVAREVLVPYR